MQDLTTGKPFGAIFRLSLPLLLSMAFQQLYNIADTMIVGRMVGAEALAAVGASYPITLIYIAVATGSSMGASVVIAKLYGAKDLARMKSGIFTAIITLVTLGVLTAAAGLLLCRPVLTALNTPTDIFEDSRTYLLIYTLGVVPMLAYNTANAIFTGLGDSRRPLIFLIISSVLNVILDLVAVGALGMGVAGAATATLVSQLAAALMANFLLIRRIRNLKTDGAYTLFDRPLFLEMVKIGVPSILQQSGIALGHTLIQGLVNGFDTAVIAGYAAASKVHNFAYMCFNTIGTALSSFTAQNLGAKRPDRIREGFKVSSMLCVGFALLVILIMQLFAAQLVGLFVDSGDNPQVIEVGKTYLRIISPHYLIISLIITGGGLVRGLGRTQIFMAVTFLDLGIRVVMSYILSGILGYVGLFWAWFPGSTTDCVILMLVYRWLCRKKELRLEGQS